MGTEQEPGTLHVHADWYADGIDCGRDLWRLDLDDDIQVQTSINVTNVRAELDGAPPEYGKDAQIFVEHDVRGAGPNRDERTKYSGDSVKCARTELYALLAMNRGEVAGRLSEMVARVKAMPSDPDFCKPMPPSKPVSKPALLTGLAAEIHSLEVKKQRLPHFMGQPAFEDGVAMMRAAAVEAAIVRQHAVDDATSLTGDARFAADVMAGCDIQRGDTLYRQMPVIIGPGIVLCDTAKRLMQCMLLGLRVYQQGGHRHIVWPDDAEGDYRSREGGPEPEGEAARVLLRVLRSRPDVLVPCKEYGSIVAALDRIDATLAELAMPSLLVQFDNTWGGNGEWLNAWGLDAATAAAARKG